MNQLLSNDVAEVAEGLKKAIEADKSSAVKAKAKVGVDYYNYKHDIMNNRIFYFDDKGQLQEDKYASNIKIPHPFLTELIDQKVQYLLSNPLRVNTDDDKLSALLMDYYNEDFQVLLQDLVENGSQKGFEYVYARTTGEDRVTFQIADGLKVMPIYDENSIVQRILRYYDRSIEIDGKQKTLHFAEVYDSSKVWYFSAEDRDEFTLDPTHKQNPAPHILAVTSDEQLVGRDYGRIPFYRFQNNQREITDLEPIKEIIDDYDLMDAFLSNNLQDFQDAIYVVKGYPGDDLSKLRQNIKSKKAIGVADGGDVDVKTIDIPVEARKTKLELDHDNIYKFGFGFDSSQVGDGNVTNVVLKGRYTLLNMKANKTEARLRAFLRWANDLIIADINRLNGTNYDPRMVNFTITQEMLVNENDIVTNEKTKADTRNVEMETLLAVAPHLPDETVLEKICEVYGLDFDEVSQKLDEQQYSPTTETVGEDNGGAE